jgi:hypothetical protein
VAGGRPGAQETTASLSKARRSRHTCFVVFAKPGDPAPPQRRRSGTPAFARRQTTNVTVPAGPCLACRGARPDQSETVMVPPGMRDKRRRPGELPAVGRGRPQVPGAPGTRLLRALAYGRSRTSAREGGGRPGRGCPMRAPPERGGTLICKPRRPGEGSANGRHATAVRVGSRSPWNNPARPLLTAFRRAGPVAVDAGRQSTAPDPKMRRRGAALRGPGRRARRPEGKGAGAPPGARRDIGLRSNMPGAADRALYASLRAWDE